MFRVSCDIEVKDGTDVNDIVTLLKKSKLVKDVKVKTLKPKKKATEKMTDYYANGKQLSLKEFKARIAAAEADVKAGRVYSMDEMWKKHGAWKKKHGLK